MPALPDTERLTSYTIASPTTGPLNVGFDLYGDDDDTDAWFEVWLDEVLLDVGDDYTVDSPSGSLGTIGRPITDARITFTTAREGSVRIVGARRPRRDTQFTTGVAVPAASHNQAYNDLMAIAREAWDRFQTTFRLPAGQTMAVLPSAEDRADMAPVFDSDGNLTLAPITPDPLIASGDARLFETTADAILATILGTVDIVVTFGRNAVGDSEPAAWKHVLVAPAHPFFITSANGWIGEFVAAQDHVDLRSIGIMPDATALAPASRADHGAAMAAARSHFTPKWIEFFMPCEDGVTSYCIKTSHPYVVTGNPNDDFPAPRYRGLGLDVFTIDLQVPGSDNGGYAFDYDGSGGLAVVTAISLANPGVVTTSAAHGFSNGQIVVFGGEGSINGANEILEGNGELPPLTPSNTYEVGLISPTQFSLKRPSDSANINTAAWTPYVSGGLVGKFNQFTTLTGGYFKDMKIGSTAAAATNPAFFRGRALWYFDFDHIKVSDLRTQGSGNICVLRSVARRGAGDEDGCAHIKWSFCQLTNSANAGIRALSSYLGASFSYLQFENCIIHSNLINGWFTGVGRFLSDNNFWGHSDLGGINAPLGWAAHSINWTITGDQFQDNGAAPDLALDGVSAASIKDLEFIRNAGEHQSIGIRIGDGTAGASVGNIIIGNTRWRIQSVTTGGATPHTTGISISVNAAARTFTRVVGSWIDDGFVIGHPVRGRPGAHGFANADNATQRTVEAVTALVLTVTDGTGLVNEAGTGDEIVDQPYTAFQVGANASGVIIGQPNLQVFNRAVNVLHNINAAAGVIEYYDENIRRTIERNSTTGVAAPSFTPLLGNEFNTFVFTGATSAATVNAPTAPTVLAGTEEFDLSVKNGGTNMVAVNFSSSYVLPASGNTIMMGPGAFRAFHFKYELTLAKYVHIGAVPAAPLDALTFSGMQVNGDHIVSQEIASTAIAGIAASRYLTDQWQIRFAGGPAAILTAQRLQATPPPGFQNYLRFTVTTADATMGAGEFVAIDQWIEGYRVAGLGFGTAGAHPVSIGVFVRSSTIETLGLSLIHFSGTRSYVTVFTIAAVNVWQFVPVTIAGDTAGTWATTTGGSLVVRIALMAGSNFQGAANTWSGSNFCTTSAQTNFTAAANTFDITGLIVLPGIELPTSDQLSRIMRSYGEEEYISMRYWEKSFHTAQVPVSNLGAGNGEERGTTAVAGAVTSRIPVMFDARKRLASGIVVTTFNPGAANAQIRDITGGLDFTATAVGNLNERGCEITGTGAAGTAVNSSIGVNWTANNRL